jgi:predicted aspartyl protease
MKQLAILFLAAVWYVSARAPVDEEKRKTPVSIVGHAIDLSPYNLVFTKIQINGTEAVALIDSGSSSPVVLSSRLARMLAIRLAEDKQSTIRGLDGKTYVLQRGRIDTLRLGSYQRRAVEIQVAGDRIETVAKQVRTSFDVILGWGFWSEGYLLLHYPQRFLRFSETPIPMGDGKIAFPYAAVNRVPVVKGIFDGTEVNLLFDTGAPMCNIDAGFAKAPLNKKVAREFTLGGQQLALEWRVKDLSVTKKSLNNVGTLGNNFLSRYAVYFDTKNKVIRLY